MSLRKGASHLATGHYAQVKKDKENRFHLYKGFDDGKDQVLFFSIFKSTSTLTRYFPIGRISEIRR